MTRVVALVAWSNGNVTMEEKGVYDIDDALATDLIAQGLCADAATYFGGGSGGGVLVVNVTIDENKSATADKTCKEIIDACLAGGAIFVIRQDENHLYIGNVIEINEDGAAIAISVGSDAMPQFSAASENEYPTAYFGGNP